MVEKVATDDVRQENENDVKQETEGVATSNCVSSEGEQKKLRKPFLAPCQPVLDVLRIHAIAEHRRFEEYFYDLIREGFKVRYGVYPEEEANGLNRK
jgi:hypothetical protein